MDKLTILICVAALFEIVAAWLFYKAGWHHGRASGVAWCNETNNEITKRFQERFD